MARQTRWKAAKAEIIHVEGSVAWAIVHEVSDSGKLRVRYTRANLESLRGLQVKRVDQLKLPTL